MKSRNYKRRFTRNHNNQDRDRESTSNYEYNVHVGSKMYQKAVQCKAKYLEMAKESFTSGDRVQGETFMQHADHYARILNEAHEIQKANRQNHIAKAENESGQNQDISQNSDEINTSEIESNDTTDHSIAIEEQIAENV